MSECTFSDVVVHLHILWRPLFCVGEPRKPRSVCTEDQTELGLSFSHMFPHPPPGAGWVGGGGGLGTLNFAIYIGWTPASSVSLSPSHIYLPYKKKKKKKKKKISAEINIPPTNSLAFSC